MNTPTPTEAHTDLVESVVYSNARSAALQIAEREARAVAAAVSSLTCTHHNDAMRAACPVCLVAALTTERDQLRAEVERLKKHCANLENDVAHLSEGVSEGDPLFLAVARAERAEADAAAYLKRAESFSKLADEAEADAERYRLVTLRQDAELAIERARLDWLESDAGVDWQWNLSHLLIVRRAAIDAAMKEVAK